MNEKCFCGCSRGLALGTENAIYLLESIFPLLCSKRGLPAFTTTWAQPAFQDPFASKCNSVTNFPTVGFTEKGYTFTSKLESKTVNVYFPNWFSLLEVWNQVDGVAALDASALWQCFSNFNVHIKLRGSNSTYDSLGIQCFIKLFL